MRIGLAEHEEGDRERAAFAVAREVLREGEAVQFDKAVPAGVADQPEHAALVQRRTELHHAFKPPVEEHAKMDLAVLSDLAAVVDSLHQFVCRLRRDRRDQQVLC